MAIAAFRSRTRRSTFIDTAAGEGSSNRGQCLRRSRSLCRYPGPLPPFSAETQLEEFLLFGDRTNNNSMVSGFSDTRLEDLAIEFLLERDVEDEVIKARHGRSSCKGGGINPSTEPDAFRLRGRPVSRRFRPPVTEESKAFSDIGGVNQKSSCGILRRQRSVSMARKCCSDLETDKCKEDLGTQLAVEKQRNQGITKSLKEFLPQKKTACLAKSRLCSKRRSRDKLSMSKCLIDEADKHIEEFLSNIEDADISSSFDGDLSDASSTIGGCATLRDPVTYNTIKEIQENQTSLASSSIESEEILLPWLNLETSNEGSSSPCENNLNVPMNYGSMLDCTLQESSMISVESEHLTREQLSDNKPQASEQIPGSSYYSLFFMNELNNHSFGEDIAVARFMQKQRIESGALVLCGRSLI